MESTSRYLDAVISALVRLPGIGHKSATRIAFYLLRTSESEIDELVNAIRTLKANITSCERCGGISDAAVCAICEDDSRDRSVICVVEQQKDVLTIEKAGGYKGLYHVLGGAISPLDGIGPQDLSIEKLLKRCRDERIAEVIIATNPTMEGDATALYLAKLLKEQGVEVMRIAHGLPVGGELDFSDSATIARAIQMRTKM
ncbi:MAG: recombination mediator RecR [Spirochaetes bacterium]|nr:recombination mediator RecR [Spirochaetota bacterium]